MEYFKKLDLKCESLIREFVMQQVNPMPANIIDSVKISHTLPDELLKTINDELSSYGIPDVWYCQSYIRRRNTVQGIHMDGVPGLNIHAAINLPIKNTEGSKFVWYDGSYATDIATNKTETVAGGTEPITYHNVQLSNNDVSVSLELDQAYLIKVDAPHSAWANPHADRWIFTMRFKGNPTFEELYDKLPDIQ